MSLRSYSNLIVMETVLDSIPSVNSDVNQVASAVFSPRIQITTSDCGTLLGRVSEVNYDLVGKVELSTGNIISLTRVKQLLSQGIYFVPTRTLDTCIAPVGVCQACYHASRQKAIIPEVGDSVEILPEYQKAVDTFVVEPGMNNFELSQSEDLYDHAYVYYKDSLVSDTTYTIHNQVLTFTVDMDDYDQVTVKYTVHTKSPFMSWLSDTYSGSLLGLKTLPYPHLPVRRSLYSSLIPTSVVELLSEKTADLVGVPVDVVKSFPLIEDPLEKALLVLSIYGVYLNIQQ